MTQIPYLRMLTWVTAVVFTAIALIVAVAFPLHASDALAFGEWSRLIALHWSRVFDASNRPLFYVLQGSLWHVIGYSDSSGRLLCGLFGLLLVVALAWLLSARPWGRIAAAVAVLFVLATPVYAAQVVSSLTDIVVAAMLALTAALAVRLPSRGRTLPLAGLAAMLAALSKPSAMLALIGIAASQLLAKESLRERMLRRVLPLAAGTAIGFSYYVIQAARTHHGLRSFLEAGVTGPYYSHLAAATRRLGILDLAWFGELLRSVLLFALLYTVGRLAGATHRATVLAAVPAVAVLSWLLPWIGGRESHLSVGAFANASSVAAWMITCCVLLAAAWAPDEAVPTRRELLVFVLWAVPPLVAWTAYATYDTRLLTPAWPGLLALMAVCSTPAVAGLARIPAAALAPIVALIVAVSLNIYNIDSLGRSGWDQWRRTPSSQRFNVDQTRAIVLPALTKALAVVRPLMGPRDRLFSPEGAFRFFFPGRVEQSFPTSCGELAGYRALVLTTDQGSRSYMQDFLHVSGDPSYWAACKQPQLRQLTSGAEGYAVFAVNG